MESKGIGDDLEKILKKIKADRIAKLVLGEDCGCQGRKDWLNKKLPYVKKDNSSDKETL